MKLTFDYIRQIAEKYGFNFERENRGNERYTLFSNEKAPGVEGAYRTLEEAWQDVSQLQQGKNPLAGNIPLS